MSNSLSTAAKNAALDALAALMGWESLHSAYPGDNGANEISGGSPAYTRKAVTWNASAAGNLDNNANPTFDVGPGVTVAFIGRWSANSAGTFYGSDPLGGGTPMPFTAALTDVITAYAHGLADGTRVVFFDTEGAVLPTGITEGTIYFVRDATTDTFKIAATSGGSAIDLTAVGAGIVQTIVPETFGGQGTLTTSDQDISLNS